MELCFGQRCRVRDAPEIDETLTSEEIDQFQIPVQERKCTDIEYFNILVVFLTFVSLSIGVAFLRGDIKRFSHGYDDYGNLCGVQNVPIRGVSKSGEDFRDKKFLQVQKSCENDMCVLEKYCVKKCGNGSEKSFVPTCRTISDKHSQHPQELDHNNFEGMISDLAICWRELAVLIWISLCFAVLPIITLRYLTKTVILAELLFVTVANAGGLIFTWIRWSDRNWDLENYEGANIGTEENQVKNLLFLAILLTIFTIYYFAVVYTLIGKIKLITVLFQEASQCIGDMPSILLLPSLTLVLVVVLFLLLVLGIAALKTSGVPTVTSNGKVTFPVDGYFSFLRGLVYFGFCWLVTFVLGIQSLITSGSACLWYFTRVKTTLKRPVLKSLIMVMKYHLGSSCFASLILAAVKPVRVIFRLLEKTSPDKNYAIYALWNITQCLLICFESLLKYLNKSAYVMTILYSEEFCPGARRALHNIMESPTKVPSVDGTGTFILMTIELCTSVGITVVAGIVFKSIDGLQSIWWPTTFIFIFSYMCCHTFTSIYEMIIESILLCFCEDCRLNNGLEKPFFMNKSLSDFMANSRRNSTENETVAQSFWRAECSCLCKSATQN